MPVVKNSCATVAGGSVTANTTMTTNKKSFMLVHFFQCISVHVIPVTQIAADITINPRANGNHADRLQCGLDHIQIIGVNVGRIIISDDNRA